MSYFYLFSAGNSIARDLLSGLAMVLVIHSFDSPPFAQLILIQSFNQLGLQNPNLERWVYQSAGAVRRVYHLVN